MSVDRAYESVDEKSLSELGYVPKNDEKKIIIWSIKG